MGSGGIRLQLSCAGGREGAEAIDATSEERT